MTLTVYPPNSDNPFAAILAVGDSWFWHPKNNLIESILALRELRDDYKSAHVLGKNGALLSEYREGKFAKDWRNELAPKNFHFSLVLISGGGNDSVDYGFALKRNCSGIDDPKQCFDEDRLAQFQDQTIGLIAALVTDVQNAARRAGIRTPPILLNGYDRPVPDGRGFSLIGGEKFKFGRPWIKPAFDRAKVNRNLRLQTSLIVVYTDSLNFATQHFASRTTGVYCPIQLGTLRTCDLPTSLGRRTASDVRGICKAG
jgi:hypothetical protein